MNKMFQFLPALLLVSVQSFAQRKYIFEQPKMASPFTITIYTGDSTKAATTAAQAFQLVDSFNAILSDYIDSSEINRLSTTAGKGFYVPVSSPLFYVLQRAQTAARLSNGAYDITLGTVIKLWRKARQTKTFPDNDSLQTALLKTGYQYVHLDSIHRSAWLEKTGMRLDAGGIGKGFVAQAALHFIQQKGFASAMVNAGGNIVTANKPGNQRGWLIGINQPEEKNDLLPQMLSLQNVSVATSGDLYQFVEINEKKYSHIVNPKTGVGLTNSKNVTVIAPDGATADWLSTACSVLSTKKAMHVIKKIKGAALLITERKNGKMKKKMSALFKNYYF